jgi:uncharacterized membrane protein
MTVEEAFKLVISGGLVAPPERQPETEPTAAPDKQPSKVPNRIAS